MGARGSLLIKTRSKIQYNANARNHHRTTEGKGKGIPHEEKGGKEVKKSTETTGTHEHSHSKQTNSTQVQSSSTARDEKNLEKGRAERPVGRGESGKTT